jgi:hypothetical protein
VETIGSFQTCIDFDHILKKRGNYSRGGYYSMEDP